MKLDNDKKEDKGRNERDPRTVISTQNLIPKNRPVEKSDITDFITKNCGFNPNKKKEEIKDVEEKKAETKENNKV